MGLWIIFSLFSIIEACNIKQEPNCNPDFFNFTNLYSREIDSIIFIKPRKRLISSNNYCGYQIQINFWDSYPVLKISNPLYIIDGFLFIKQNIIYCTIGHKERYQFRIFNFNLNKGETEEIQFYNLYENILDHKKFIDSIKCNTSLDDKFVDKQNADTIYKFRFKQIGYFYPNSDLVFFVSKKYGLYGIYCSNLFIDNGRVKEYIYTYVGQIFKERFGSCYIYLSTVKQKRLL